MTRLAAPSPSRPSNADWFAHEVAVLVAAAITRLDERQRLHCPHCGHRYHDEQQS